MAKRRAKANLVVSDDSGGNQQPHATRWTAELIAMLGKRPDAQVAAAAKCSNESVRRQRLRLAIPPHRPEASWTMTQLALLDKHPLAEVARKVGCTLNAAKIQLSRRRSRRRK